MSPQKLLTSYEHLDTVTSLAQQPSDPFAELFQDNLKLFQDDLKQLGRVDSAQHLGVAIQGVDPFEWDLTALRSTPLFLNPSGF
ncbi:hypothetical protein T484DRAFT_1985678 [Baffinella frigidus]|nr:hypothetical protein T484DRAFT_1985678 [Cryptophyta sp. CCMP2293]